MTALVLALGSNLGDRLAHLQSAVDLLAAALTDVRVSPVYETDPVGGPAQDDYLNAVVVATAPPGLDPLALAQRAEAARGRRRDVAWGPRTLDVDVIDVDGLVSADLRRTLPHPRAHERSFVLAPWADLNHDAVLPGHGRVADLLQSVGRGGLRRRDDLVLQVPA